MPPETFPIALFALLLDALFGYPDWISRKIGHPVTWVGALISLADRRLNKEDGPVNRKLLGILTIICVAAAASATGLLIQMAARSLPFGWALTGVAASTLFAGRSLYSHVRDVQHALDTGGLEAGRQAVSRIVGRDPETLDCHGVARAAIESLAENASDGVVAPVLWFMALGLPGLAAYKAINTADSMIGHRTPRYEAFGWASARLDDLVNLPASRLTAGLFGLAATFCASPAGALSAVLRDAPRHRSPNAGWPEAAMAGALGLKLAGPRSYGGVAVPDAYMGSGRADATTEDIGRALRLAKIAWLILLATIAVCALLTVQA
ncbi:MAG: adenosylcobinamide-phosphate synthase CbiB [Rhodomicrobium sp.]